MWGLKRLRLRGTQDRTTSPPGTARLLNHVVDVEHRRVDRVTVSRKRGFELARWTIALAVVLTLVVPFPVTASQYYDVDITEEGPSLAPGEDSSDIAFESHPSRNHYLISGYGHAGEFRILDRDLDTVKVIEPPADGFEIRGCAFSYWQVRLLVWGRASGDAADTVHLYDVNQSAYVSDIVPNGTVPLVTIDQARLFATELILMVAGRDGNGTSKVMFIETMTNMVLNQLSVPGNRTVIHAEENGNHIPVMDERGGLLVFSSFNWTLSEQIGPLDADPTVYELHPDRFWTLGTEDGTVIVGQHYGDGFSYQHQVDEGPVEGALYSKLPNGAVFTVTARPAEGDGSILEVWWTGDGDWPFIEKMSLDRSVAFIHHVPGSDDLFFIGYRDGSVIQYRIEIKEIPPEDNDPWYKEGRIWVTVAVVAVIVLLAWRRMGKRTDG